MDEKELKEKVESFGVLFEREGIPPVAARIIGYLMFSQPPQRTFFEIVDFVQASKSSVSTAMSRMQERGLVTYFTLSGDRKRYFQLDMDSWVKQEERRIKFISELQVFIKDAADIHKDDSKDFAKSLYILDSFFDEYIDELPKVIAKWEGKLKEKESGQ